MKHKWKSVVMHGKNPNDVGKIKRCLYCGLRKIRGGFPLNIYYEDTNGNYQYFAGKCTRDKKSKNI